MSVLRHSLREAIMGNQGAVFRASLIRKDFQITLQVNKPMHYTTTFTDVRYMYVFAQNNLLNEPRREKIVFFAYAKTKTKIGFAPFFSLHG